MNSIMNDESIVTSQHVATTSAPLLSGEDTLYELLFSGNDDGDDAETTKPSRDVAFAYLQELNAFHLDRLSVEPLLLRDKRAQCGNEIKSLAFSNYKTFVRTAQCSRQVYDDFARIDAHLEELINTRFPPFSHVCDSFTRSIQVINQQRRGNTLTLQKHTQLLEFLEISQLMDTCVRNEYYEEALDLAAYVKRLDKKYGQSIALVEQIVQDVNKSLNLMLRQLMQQLKSNLQFNECLKCISLIRRLDVYTEAELRIKFLQLRDAWLQSLLANIPAHDPYAHITKIIEENRIHLFDIITQYRAIFADDDSSPLLLTSSTLLPKTSELNESKLFFSWLVQKIRNFLAVLANDLKLGVGNRIDSVLSQAMYFGLAFSRVGLDFRALMIPIFEQAILDQLERALKQALVKFDESLTRLNWSELVAEHHGSLNPRSSDSISKLASSIKSTAATSNLIVNPPLVLMEFQPLAVYLNTLLNAFNELRLCAPFSLHGRILDEIRKSIKDLASRLRTYHRQAKLDQAENDLFARMLTILAAQLVPFIERCLAIIYPPEQLQKAYGVGSDAATRHRICKESGCMRLDSKQLLEPLSDLMPAAATTAATQQQLIEATPDEFTRSANSSNTNEKVRDDDEVDRISNGKVVESVPKFEIEIEAEVDKIDTDNV